MGTGQYQKGRKRITQPVLRVDPVKVKVPVEEKPPYYQEVMDYLGKIPEGGNPGMFLSRTQGWVLGALFGVLAIGVVFAIIVIITRAHQQETNVRRLHDIEVQLDRFHKTNLRMERKTVELETEIENLKD